MTKSYASATASNERGFVTVARLGSDIVLMSYSTGRGFTDLGAQSEKQHLDVLIGAAKDKLVEIEAHIGK